MRRMHQASQDSKTRRGRLALRESLRSPKASVDWDLFWGGLVTATVLSGVMWPLTWPVDRDSFPLSNYPMFAWPRLTTTCSIAAVYGSGVAGRRERLTPQALGKASTFVAALGMDRQLGQLLRGDCADL